MKKLFQLKKWLTLPDTARHLSIVFGEEVSEADVLRLVLDGYLKISVSFVNYASAKFGKVSEHSQDEIEKAIQTGIFPAELKWTCFANDLKTAIRGEKSEDVRLLLSLRIDGNRYLTLDENVTTIEGVWDLPMIGAERLDVEHHYQVLTGGPSVTLCSLDGAFIEGSDGTICQLQECFEDNEYQSGSRAALTKLKQRIAESNMGQKEAEELLNKHTEARKKYLDC